MYFVVLYIYTGNIEEGNGRQKIKKEGRKEKNMV